MIMSLQNCGMHAGGYDTLSHSVFRASDAFSFGRFCTKNSYRYKLGSTVIDPIFANFYFAGMDSSWIVLR